MLRCARRSAVWRTRSDFMSRKVKERIEDLENLFDRKGGNLAIVNLHESNFEKISQMLTRKWMTLPNGVKVEFEVFIQRKAPRKWTMECVLLFCLDVGKKLLVRTLSFIHVTTFAHWCWIICCKKLIFVGYDFSVRTSTCLCMGGGRGVGGC